MTTDWEAAFIAKGKPVPAWATERGAHDYSMLPERCREYAEILGLVVIKRDVGLWCKTVDEWNERGADADIVRRAAALHRERGLPVKGPQSFTWAINDIINNPARNNPAGIGGFGAVSGTSPAPQPAPRLGSSRTAGDF